jgi:hypothetical protein
LETLERRGQLRGLGVEERANLRGVIKEII